MRIENEQEAIVAIFIAAIDIDGELTDFETEKVANTLVFCRKFGGCELGDVFAKTFQLKNQNGTNKNVFTIC